MINNHQNVVDRVKAKADRSVEQALMSREELLTVQYNTAQYLKSVQKTVEKVRLLQSRIDELTVKRSKEFDAPLVDTTKEDKESLFVSGQVMENDSKFSKEVASKFQQNLDMYDQALQNAINTTKKG